MRAVTSAMVSGYWSIVRCVGRIGAAMCGGVLMRRHVQGYSYSSVIVGIVLGHKALFIECMNLNKNLHSFHWIY
ncbi:hypothetical protein [Bacillus cereus group sp. BfR-BA-01356]|uniref:hypothetical protein n=1 Tax=Bacillus cereus group sp. BfR-BA-01356 TaxID=2920319 RepID=UPI001F590C75